MWVLQKVTGMARALWDRLTGKEPPERTLSARAATVLPGPEPGVGVCLSGGGSRALAAGLGQLRGLAHLEPGRLVTTTTPGHTPAETLDVLPAGNPGQNIGGDFSVIDLVVQMLGLRIAHDTPWNMMWQVLIARHLLQPYGLYESGARAEPASLFALDSATLQSDVVGPNPALATVSAHLPASGPGRLKRPYMICNTAMFVKDDHEAFEYLAPVQATSSFTGIVGSPDGVDANGREPGGGGISSFAFNSALDQVSGDRISVSQARTWSLTDIVGASSAAFAETLQNLLAEAKEDPQELHRHFQERTGQVHSHLSAHTAAADHQSLLSKLEGIAVHDIEHLLRELDPEALIPRYEYFPVRNLAPDPGAQATRFADGGSLENTGVAGMLAHDQVHSIISFVNADVAISSEDKGLNVSDQIPVLFGFRPFDKDHGYRRYPDAQSALLAQVEDLGSDRIYRYNHVFEADGFDAVLAGLASAAGSDLATGPAVVRTELTTVDNAWFGIRGGRKVTVVWYVLGPVSDWNDKLSSDVHGVVDKLHGFPNYSTASTKLDATHVNAMSNLTAWSVGSSAQADLFRDLFTT